MKRLRFVLLLTLLLVGCDATAVRTAHTNNRSIDVDVLFDYDGCRGYRADVGSRNIYFVRCNNASVDTSWVVSNGKTSEIVSVRSESR